MNILQLVQPPLRIRLALGQQSKAIEPVLQCTSPLYLCQHCLPSTIVCLLLDPIFDGMVNDPHVVEFPAVLPRTAVKLASSPEGKLPGQLAGMTGQVVKSMPQNYEHPCTDRTQNARSSGKAARFRSAPPRPESPRHSTRVPSSGERGRRHPPSARLKRRVRDIE